MNIICVAPYIPPSNSNYFQKEYFDNLELFLEKFKEDSTLCFGDLNTRFGEPRVIRDDANYNPNPDTVVTSNGRTLKKLVIEKVYHIVNGLYTDKINCESNFSYFRGGLRSQNDVCITNDINLIASFSFGEKLIYSDHKPIQGNSVANLDIFNRCALYSFKDDHYINRRMKPTIKLKNLNMEGMIADLNKIADSITDKLSSQQLSSNELCALIMNGIYNSGKSNRIRNKQQQQQMNK